MILHIGTLIWFHLHYSCQLYICPVGSAASNVCLAAPQFWKLFARENPIDIPLQIFNVSIWFCYVCAMFQSQSAENDDITVWLLHILWLSSRAAAIPKAKGGARLQMKLVYNHLAPLFLYFLKWIDCSCAYFLPRILNPFHILIYKVCI